jgi:hypothetical protein
MLILSDIFSNDLKLYSRGGVSVREKDMKCFIKGVIPV